MGEDVALRSPTIIMLWSVCALQPNSIYFLNLYASGIGEKMVRNTISLFLLNSFGLKCIMSDIRKPTFVCFLDQFI